MWSKLGQKDGTCSVSLIFGETLHEFSRVICQKSFSDTRSRERTHKKQGSFHVDQKTDARNLQIKVTI